MLAAVVDRYGPPEVVAVREVPDPAPPGPGQVLVRVHATSVNSGDARIRGARFPWGFGLPARLAFGLRGPRRPVLGGVYSGVVVALGPGVPHLREGEQVAGMTGPRMGAHAELAVVPANRLTALPAGVSHEDAAGILFGATTARYFLADTPVGPTARVLVIGASGAVGTAAVQLAALAGAQVTGVCSAAKRRPRHRPRRRPGPRLLHASADGAAPGRLRRRGGRRGHPLDRAGAVPTD